MWRVWGLILGHVGNAQFVIFHSFSLFHLISIIWLSRNTRTVRKAIQEVGVANRIWSLGILSIHNPRILPLRFPSLCLSIFIAFWLLVVCCGCLTKTLQNSSWPLPPHRPDAHSSEALISSASRPVFLFHSHAHSQVNGSLTHYRLASRG